MNISLRAKKGYGDFGNLSQNYDKARKGFPEESTNYIFEKIGLEKPYILDMGCGTGIATKQLFEKGAKVIGTDVDPKMIRQAETDNHYEIEYKTTPAEKQPFDNSTFDAVTAFSAFHWFANTKALTEIKRILKPQGYFFVINKNETGDFKKRNKEILQQFIKEEMPNIKKEYAPKKILEENDFQLVKEKIFSVTEFFTLEDALYYIQTMSVWNLVPKKQRGKAVEEFRKHFSKTSNARGLVERQLNIVVVSGKTT